jgi:KaiC/GvpD/RAD55 family RecA-like ATPase
MSELKDDVLKVIAEVAETEKLKQETQAKKAILDKKRIDNQLEALQQNERELELARQADYGALSKERVAEIVIDNDAYMDAAKNPIPFICKTFDGVVPFFRKNFILVGARTGEGKSTAVANIAYTVLTKKNPVNGKGYRVLVITNEERAEDFYNRVTSLIKGWHYTNHSEFTEEQRKEFRRMIPVLANGGRLTVVDNNHNGSHGVTTTLEGIESIFDSLLAKKEYYDIVLIDYYQNIISSKKDAYMKENDVQAKLTRMMDRYKNIYPAPIVMMAQIMPPDKDDKTPFQYRIKGRKIIMDATTFAVEMVRDSKNLCTYWHIHKSRFTNYVGEKKTTAYNNGKFEPYTTEWAEKVQKMAYERKAREINETIDKSNGLPDVFKDENKNGSGTSSSNEGS